MTQPTTLATSFDTSLVDVQKSFSSTETNTSVSSAGKENMQPSEDTGQGEAAPPRRSSPFKEVSNLELYEKWADTYDHDGNILQFVDDLQMMILLPEFVNLTTKRGNQDDPLTLLDLGCGTGRNTVKLTQAPWNHSARNVNFHAWDSSQAMLDVAKSKLSAQSQHTVDLAVVDISNLANVPDQYYGFFDGLISTLVLEHIDIDTYFAVIKRLLKPGAFALVTSMHDEMGRISRAGFKTASGERFKGMSYVYTPAETVDAAKVAGLEVVGEVGEIAVDERMIDGGVLDNGVKVERGAVTERARKWIGTKVWYGMTLRKT